MTITRAIQVVAEARRAEASALAEDVAFLAQQAVPPEEIAARVGYPGREGSLARRLARNGWISLARPLWATEARRRWAA